MDAINEKIKEMYFAGKYLDEMRKEIGLNEGTISKRIARMKEAGELPERRRLPKRIKKYTISRPAKNTEKDFIPDGVTVNCTLAVSKKCRFGICEGQSVWDGLCNYSLVTHKMRGCDPCECYKFIRRTRQKPRFRIEE